MADFVKSRRYSQCVANTLGHNGADTISLNTIGCKLWIAGPTPTPDSVPSDFSIATFGGYAPVAAVASLTQNQPDGSADLLYEASFNDDGSTTVTNNVLGAYFISADASPIYIGAVQFDNPIPMAHIYDAINLDLTLNFGSPNDTSAVEID